MPSAAPLAPPRRFALRLPRPRWIGVGAGQLILVDVGS